MINLLFTGITLIGSFTGQYTEGFENHPSNLQQRCVNDHIFNNHATLCVGGEDEGAGNCTIASSFASQCCTTNPQAGTKFLWTQTSHYYSSYVEINFDEPVSRFGGYFAYWNCSTGMVATFYSENNTVIGTMPLTGVPACTWTWNGWQFDDNLPCKRVKIQNAYWFGIELDGLQMDFAPIQPGMDTCFPNTPGVATCPCSNLGTLGRGCGNSANSTGARLTSAGVPSIAADTLVFTASGMPATASCTLLQLMPTNGSSIYQQGILCGTITVSRMFTRTATNGTVVLPGPGDVTISARASTKGDPLLMGMGRQYAIVYSSAALPNCRPTALNNVTQTQYILWLP
jgi:hypothetical protein